MTTYINPSELTTIAMVNGNEKKYSKVVIDGVLKEWVGIGWVVAQAPLSEVEKLPRCTTIMSNLKALQAFALRNGRNRWRERLWCAWSDGNYRKWGSSAEEASLLQALRNHRDYGPGTNFIKKFNPKGELE